MPDEVVAAERPEERQVGYSNKATLLGSPTAYLPTVAYGGVDASLFETMMY